MPKLVQHPDLGFKATGESAAVQARLLRRHLAHAARSPFYRELFSREHFNPRQVRTPADLARLPFTTKHDLEERGRDFLAAPAHEVADVCESSGTTGLPVTLLQTGADLERLAYNEESSFRAAGIVPGERVLIAAALDRCFMAGLAYFLGLTRLGATAIRGGSGSVAFLAELVLRHRPTALVGVPTLIAAVAEALAARGAQPASLGVARIVCIGEPVRREDLSLSALGERLAALWGASVLGTYASTEMATSFADCALGTGGHLLPDLMVVEIVDEQGLPLPPGAAGEVVATPLQVSGMPLVRFRTGDIATLHPDPCACGRTSPRLGPVIGRKSQMLKIKGTTVYPPAIFAALQEIPGVQGYYLEVRDTFELSDHITVTVGAAGAALTPESVAEKIAVRTRVKPEVVIVAPEEIVARTIRADKRKPITFFDLREKRNVH
ncbi:MAG: phenylacetate--CoA ligase family protein [Candidatus Methylomirabilia bacterium]